MDSQQPNDNNIIQAILVLKTKNNKQFDAIQEHLTKQIDDLCKHHNTVEATLLKKIPDVGTDVVNKLARVSTNLQATHNSM
eukprot:4551045-Ditylum_brightwellii.AAC.1